MLVEIIKYEVVHGYELLDRGIRETDFLLSSIGDWESAVRLWGERGPAFTLKINNVVEACGGIAMLDSSMGDCWQLVPHSDHGIVVYRSVLRKFVELMRDYEFRRLQAYIVVGFKDAERMACKLGFKYEGTLINYCVNGESMNLYARTF